MNTDDRSHPMTAPDVKADVRARFEEWFSGKYPEVNKQASSGDEMALFARVLALQGYRAAHADLAGEVRELVEAAEEMVGVYVAKYAMESGTTHGPLEFQFRALEAALAKFHPTPQEKP